MKNRMLKALAAFGLSVCVLAGSLWSAWPKRPRAKPSARTHLEDHDRV
mgnify:CR=1 FL=1